MIFEATLKLTNIPKGSTIDDVKKFLTNFRNEMYAERGKQQGEFYLHFYKKMRAKDAQTFMANTPSQFTGFELISHKKEIGTNQDAPTQPSGELKRKKKEQRVVDNDGFMVIN